MADSTTETEVTAKQVAVVHAMWDDTNSEYTRTILALASKDDLTVTDESEDTDFTPSAEYSTRRYATSGTIDLEISSAVATDLSALELLGIVDSDGKYIKSGPERRVGFGEDEHLEFAYFNFEPDYANVDIVADSELLNRFGDVKIQNPEFDPSEAPLTVSFEGWVEGEVWMDYPGHANVGDGSGGTT